MMGVVFLISLVLGAAGAALLYRESKKESSQDDGYVTPDANVPNVPVGPADVAVPDDSLQAVQAGKDLPAVAAERMTAADVEEGQYLKTAADDTLAAGDEWGFVYEQQDEPESVLSLRAMEDGFVDVSTSKFIPELDVAPFQEPEVPVVTSPESEPQIVNVPAEPVVRNVG